MLTVDDINKTLAEKGLYIKLPLPSHFLVRNMKILEKRKIPGGVGVLLSVDFVNENGDSVSDLFHCEGQLEIDREKKLPPTPPPPLSDLLPLRTEEGFQNEEEGMAYLGKAIGHLLEDKGYRAAAMADVDLYYEWQGNGFFVDLALRCDDLALSRANELVELRHRRGVDHEYGLVIPAFQETLGVSLLTEERWTLRNQEFLAANRIGVYAVDNWNPNLIFAFGVHPSPREIKKYFMTTGPKWSLVRSRYVLRRDKKGKPGQPGSADDVAQE
ncbi:MAG: hypothetical protein A2Y61_07525 [Chloroflexi bacterium RBG_13_60_13]|nr:MAG: hypothetical protein A2Y61_07525 [Chloroflexi bacterium RBG_13_60_13]